MSRERWAFYLLMFSLLSLQLRFVSLVHLPFRPLRLSKLVCEASLSRLESLYIEWM